MAVIDVGGSVREGEELDVQAITDWLNQQGVNVEGPLELTQYSGGASNWTYRLQYANADLILRRRLKAPKPNLRMTWHVNIMYKKPWLNIIQSYLKWWRSVRMNQSLAVTSM
jgi:Predicted aminoglycoside phosphotransferase